MLSKASIPKNFTKLTAKDKDLTMFMITNLTLTDEKNANMVYMTLKLKRKVASELLTTYLPTILLLLITFVTIFFDKDLFGDAIAVNLTIMLVMTTIFTSKIEELPPTSDMKMIDIWLIFCLVVPFLEVILRTTIECLNCSCDICKVANSADTAEEKSTAKEEKEGEDLVQGKSSGVFTRVLVGTSKVFPQQVLKDFAIEVAPNHNQALTEVQDAEDKVEKEDPRKRGLEIERQSCRRGFLRRSFEFTGELSTLDFYGNRLSI